jgi:hypothetical protein
MKFIRSTREIAECQLSIDELIILRNALKEAINSSNKLNFQAMSGISLEDAITLIERLNLLIEELGKNKIFNSRQ